MWSIFQISKILYFYYCINYIIFISKVWPSFWRNVSYTKMYFGSLTYHYQKTGERFFLKMTLRHFGFGHTVEKIAITIILAIVSVSSSIL